MKVFGRPEYTNEQYQRWLNGMGPFLKAGYFLYYAINKADLIKDNVTIYENWGVIEWLSKKTGVFAIISVGWHINFTELFGVTHWIVFYIDDIVL